MGAAIGAAVVGLAGTVGASMCAADSAEDANFQNALNAALQRKLELQLAREARGQPTPEGGVSSLLPFYGDEVGLYRDAKDYYDATKAITGTPQEQILRYKNTIDRYGPVFNAGGDLISSIYSGDMLANRLAENQPVAGARRAVAQGQQQGVLEGLLRRINELKTERKLQGYTGGGSFEEQQLLAGTIGARQKASEVMTRAELENAMEERSIREAQRELGLRSLDLPLARAKQALELETLPLRTANELASARMAPFDFFRIGPGQVMRPTANPTVTAIPNLGQIIGQGVATSAGTLGNYYMNQQLIKQLNARTVAPTASPAVTGTGATLPTFDYSNYGVNYDPGP